MLPSLSQLDTIRVDDFVNQITNYLDARSLRANAMLAAETAVFWFARKRWFDYCSQDVRARLHQQAATRKLSVPLDRISAVTACMNRNEHIKETLPTWLASNRFEEIVIVDYGSLEPLSHTLAPTGLLDHPSIRLIRVEAETWCLAEAFNTALLNAQAPFTMKLDADTLMRGNASMSLRLSAQQFKTGNWRTFENNVLNGIVLAPTEAIKKVGGYNEQIRRYGWDDCDLYDRLSEFALVKTDLAEQEFRSLDHSDNERVAHSDLIAKSNDINRLIQGNRVLTNLLPKWTDKGSRQFAFNLLNSGDKQLMLQIQEFAYKISSIQDAYLYSEDSSYSYPDMLHDIATHVLKVSQPLQTVINIEKASIILMVSIYEDPAEPRRLEMIRCLRINTQIFDKVIVLYEQPVSSEIDIAVSMSVELKRLTYLSRFDKQLADIEIITINERPTYRDFFEISNSRAMDGPQRPWFVIANSDIAFDSTIQRIHELDNPDEVMIWLSRWDVCSDDSSHEPSECYLDPDGIKWALIESTINGSRVPNYLSADAWIYKKEPDDWEEYTYKLGSYFCDSFFANRSFRSGRSIVNPCRSIRCFHYHNALINSSATKFEDKGNIELLHSEEKERIGGDDPVAGVQWSTIETCNSRYLKPNPYRWNPEGGLWLRLGFVVNIPSILLLIEAALKATETSGKNVFISLLCDERYDNFLTVILEFADYLSNPRLFIDLRYGVFDPTITSPEHNLSFWDNCPICHENWDQLAQTIVSYALNKQHPRYPDSFHLQLLQFLTIQDLYSVNFFLTRYPDRFRQHHFEAEYATQLSLSSLNTRPVDKPRFSLISSLFKARVYLPRLLENYEAIASLGPCELIIIDVNNDCADKEIIDSFIARSEYGCTIQYLKLPNDPGIYGAWMRAISMAQAPFVSNFNADDLRSPIHPHFLADFLTQHNDIDVCFTSLKPSTVANQGWYEHHEQDVWFNWYNTGYQFTLDDFLTQRDGAYCSQNVAHCMPMWRKEIHSQLGPIREDQYGTSADWAFWLHCLKSGKKLALASSNPLGIYYINPKSHNRINDADGTLENKILRDYYGISQVEFMQQ